MDKPQTVAFNLNAPQAERQDALTELQKSHIDTFPQGQMQELIAEIELLKSVGENIVPFPSTRVKTGKPGMQSVYLDDWALSVQGEYWERPGVLNFDSLRMMVEQTPVLNAVVLTRLRQVQRFCRVAESGNELPGFEIRHIDKSHSLTKSEQDAVQQLNRFFNNCGWEFNPRRRKALKRDSFAQFMGKVVRDSLVLDSVAIETEWKKDKNKGLDGFYSVDGGTIRLCTEQGYHGDDELFAVQVVQGVVRSAYGYDDLIYEPRNPRSDVRSCGYGMGETELLIKVVTGFLNAMTYNLKGFDSNAIPKGLLTLVGEYSQQDLDAFKRQWNAMVRGINNAWSLPIMTSSDPQAKAIFDKFNVEYDEMYFSKWMTFLTSIICAIYGMSPAEINFDSFTAGSTSALSGSDTAEKLAASKDSGLRPVLAYFENLFSDYIVSDFSPSFVFRWTGLDPENEERKHEMRKLLLTVNEARAEEGYEKHENEMLGNAPLNPSLTGLYMQSVQPPEDEQPEQGNDEDLQKSYGLPRVFSVMDI